MTKTSWGRKWGKAKTIVYSLCVAQNVKDVKGKTDKRKGRNNIKMNEREEMVMYGKKARGKVAEKRGR